MFFNKSLDGDIYKVAVGNKYSTESPSATYTYYLYVALSKMVAS